MIYDFSKCVALNPYPVLSLMLPASFIIVPPWSPTAQCCKLSGLQSCQSDMDLCWVETAVRGCTAQSQLGHQHYSGAGGLINSSSSQQISILTTSTNNINQQHQPTTPYVFLSLSHSVQPIYCNCNGLHPLTNQVQKISKSCSAIFLWFRNMSTPNWNLLCEDSLIF